MPWYSRKIGIEQKSLTHSIRPFSCMTFNWQYIYIYPTVSKNSNQMPNVHFVLKRTKSIVVSIDFRGVFFHVHAMLQIQILLLLFIFHKHFFSSPGQRPCELFPSLGVRPSVVRHKLSHLNLLWNHWPKLNLTWQGWSLGGFLSKLCLTAPPSIQDGCC